MWRPERGGCGERRWRASPAVLKIGLPALKAALDQGAGLEEAGAAALLALTAGTADTNLFARGGLEGQRWAARQAGLLLEGGPRPDPEAVRALDRAMIQRNLSPGGCADLLAITYFLYFMWKGSVSPRRLMQCEVKSGALIFLLAAPQIRSCEKQILRPLFAPLAWENAQRHKNTPYPG